MENQDYTVRLTVQASPQEVFKQINRVTAWWTKNLQGDSEKLNDVFTVNFPGMHVSTQKLIECIPDKKVTWMVTDSHLTFIQRKTEWTDTTIQFDISRNVKHTEVLFTHKGLNPAIECYGDCAKGWDYFIKGSLFKLLTEGTGTPE
ncbi:ATPase [Cytophaga hutchinsonii]|uniref:Activator of Hsp90 ATPase 1 family protein n=1 Tax=Cytophaga hutchinsonii (strain ATCC 33406 / DSM 1761 / CIP 103989 / NBRC 15051 / NCIMB 9469 / D465) TaxID=269798 RepID=A0A6N4ST18_CYTH3|nr:ATPase [Cytophaga hutchinsonii]ABG59560.1 conserved hypothetical protein [Cytophaga hutchinsonii ATCC 33406]SFX95515.1 hypothetical protein SAMN04487930_11475 [Cytophaga hutchinsonii ATCC 33406]